ncbi:hypothetical protein FRC12_006149 [Ceratobasidium sp. 428]|nr:hypothetical protein FRC12_006149 [Ceratobasidium sp. 428]
MTSRAKKRKATDDVEPAQSSLTLSKEDICDKISKCPPKDIAKKLFESVKTATPSELQAIQSLLGPLLEKANDPLHCVRCHMEYAEPENSTAACKIEHMEVPTWSHSMKKYGARRMYTYPCCNREPQAESRCYYSTPTEEHCFVGRHTTDPKEVSYYDSDSRSGNENIVTCEDVGCGLELSDLGHEDLHEAESGDESILAS